MFAFFLLFLFVCFSRQSQYLFEVDPAGLASSHAFCRLATGKSESRCVMIRGVLNCSEDSHRLVPPGCGNRVKENNDKDPCVFEYKQTAHEREPLAAGLYSRFPSYYWLSMTSLRKCFARLKVSKFNQLWTLHNLRYGILEAYSFTDIAVNSKESIQTNPCNFRVHEVKVDLKKELEDRIGRFASAIKQVGEVFSNAQEIKRFLKENVDSAADFHFDLVNLFSGLQDQHTRYVSPFSMFRIDFPIAFDSKMVNGKQVVTLRFGSSVALTELMEIHRKLFGYFPLDGDLSKNNQVITLINDKPALDFLNDLVSSDFGPLTGGFHDINQRLNGFLFSAPWTSWSLTDHALPLFDAMRIRLADGSVHMVHLIARVVDLVKKASTPFSTITTTPTPTSAQDGGDTSVVGDNQEEVTLLGTINLNTFINTNKDFEDFMEVDGILDGGVTSFKKLQSLWKLTHEDNLEFRDRMSDNVRRNLMGEEAILEGKRGQTAAKESVLFFEEELEDNKSSSEQNEMDEGSNSKASRGGAGAGAGSEKKTQSEEEVDTETEFMEALSSWGNRDTGHKIIGDTLVLVVTTFETHAATSKENELYKSMIRIQQEARRKGVTKILIDLTANGGGHIKRSYALQWYFVQPEEICAPLRKRMTWNWKVWLRSFGKEGYEDLLESIESELGEEVLGDWNFLNDRFSSLSEIVTLMFDGMKFGSYFKTADKDWIVDTLERKKEYVLGNPLSSNGERAKRFMDFLRSRDLLAGMNWFVSDGRSGTVYPFREIELIDAETGLAFSPPMKAYEDLESFVWGPKPAQYSRAGEFRFCRSLMAELTKSIGSQYDRNYWTDVAFVSDGTCGSACSLFAMTLQLSGVATAFSYGGSANTPLDVSAFAGGNVVRYNAHWRMTIFTARLFDFATLGRSDWSKLFSHSWNNLPGPFPTPASASYNHNMVFSRRLGPESLPRQYYFIPAQKHINMWAHDPKGRKDVYDQILRINWQEAKANPQFPSEGFCPWWRHDFVDFTSSTTPIDHSTIPTGAGAGVRDKGLIIH